MPVLFLMRHGEAANADRDFDRPLNERGEEDAPTMGARLKAMGVQPDLIISSTALRAKQTAKKIAAAIGYDKDAIKWYEKLYHCIPAVFEEVLYEVDDSVQTVFIIAHNPGITEFVNELSPAFETENVPTCAVVGAEFSAMQWSDFNLVEKQVILYEYPKKHI